MNELAAPPNETAAAAFRDFRQRVQQAVGRVVVGMEGATDQFLTALAARGHVLLEGVPGTAKTTLAKAFARVLGLEYQRVQFTPDLLPSDIAGTTVLDRQKNDFVLRKGPLFCQLLLADEINRAPAKTQSALLEAMQEHQVTIEGHTLPLPQPFLVLATQNPIEQEGVYRLPEAQLDRFLMRVEITYPARGTEVDMLRLHGGLPATADQAAGNGQALLPTMPEPLFDAKSVLAIQGLTNTIFAEPKLLQYIVDLVRLSRQHNDLALGASPRAALYLLQAARARALLVGRTYCTHEDVHAVAASVLCHRLILKPEAEIEGVAVAGIVKQLLDRVPVIG